MPRERRGYWIEPRGKNGIYQLCWTADRIKRSKSLRTADKAEAEAWLAAFLAELDQPDKSKRPTIAGILEGYLADREGVVVDFDRVKLTARHLKDSLGWLPAEDIRPSHTRTYAKQRNEAGISDGTIRRELTTLRAALHWAKGERLITSTPAVKLPPRPAPRDRWLTREEAAALVDACGPHHLRLFVQVALHTASRRNSILELTWPQVDLGRRLIYFNPPGRRPTLKKRVTVPINDRLAAILEAALTLAETPYVIEWNGERVLSVKKAFARAVQKAGLTAVTPHVLRHTAATWMAMEGVDLREIQLYLGHDSLHTTEKHYAHHHPDYLRRAARALE